MSASDILWILGGGALTVLIAAALVGWIRAEARTPRLPPSEPPPARPDPSSQDV